jgi:hypothetical protein
MFKDYKDCSHEKLVFGSGDYQLFCTDCQTNWIQHPWPREDGQWGQNLSGEWRVKFPDNLTFIETKAQEKGLI